MSCDRTDMRTCHIPPPLNRMTCHTFQLHDMTIAETLLQNIVSFVGLLCKRDLPVISGHVISHMTCPHMTDRSLLQKSPTKETIFCKRVSATVMSYSWEVWHVIRLRGVEIWHVLMSAVWHVSWGDMSHVWHVYGCHTVSNYMSSCMTCLLMRHVIRWVKSYALMRRLSYGLLMSSCMYDNLHMRAYDLTHIRSPYDNLLCHTWGNRMTTSTWGGCGDRMTTSSWQPPHDNLLMWRLSCRPYDNLWQPAHVEVVRMTKETYNITCKGDVIGLFWRLSCRPYDNLWQPPHVEVVMWRLSCMTRQPYDRCDMSYGCHTADMRRYDWQISFAKRGVEIWHVLMSVLSHDMTMSCRCNALIDAMHSSRYVTHRDMSLIDVMHSSM